jgi:4-amino-4-deoxy-L-arabinose transferase-like glycosyltransferase
MDESLKRGVIRNKRSLLQTAARAFQPARSLLAAYGVEGFCAVILLAMSLNLVAVTARKSITADELVLIPAAYYHLVTDDFQLVSEHPPLCKLLAGLPLLFIQPNEVQNQPVDPSVSRGDREWAYAMRFWHDNSSRFETISFWARLPMIALTIAFGLVIFLFTRDLFGVRAALFAVALFSLEPTILAHARVVQTDMPAAFGFLFSAFALYRYLLAPNWKLAAATGAAAGIAMLGKYSMVIVGPILLLVFLVLLWRHPDRRTRLAGHAITAVLALLLVVNAGYFFHHRPLTETDSQWVASSFPSSQTLVWGSVRALKLVLPTDFVLGTYWQLHHTADGHNAGLLGMYSQRGWWYYFPVAFALKTTIPFLLLSVSAIVWGIYRVAWKREWSLLVLLLPFVLYTVLMMINPIDIGIRYYLPAYGFLFIVCGGMLEALLHWGASKRIRLAWVPVVIAFSWICVEAWRAYPNYMPYMNQLASSRPHWWYLSDSNVEWGDDVKDLAAYLQARGETRVHAILLGGYATLGFYGVNYEDALTPATSPPRYTALGASFLNGSTIPFYEVDGKRVSDETRVNTFDSFRHRPPEAIIGGSIYVYRMHD